MSIPSPTIYKLLLVGSPAVGKSTLLKKIKTNLFDHYRTLTTQKIVDSHTINFQTNYGMYTFDVWERSNTTHMLDTNYKRDSCAIIMFDMGSPSSYKFCIKLCGDIQAKCGRIPIVLFGNKCDTLISENLSMINNMLLRFNDACYYGTDNFGSNLFQLSTNISTKSELLSPFNYLLKCLTLINDINIIPSIEQIPTTIPTTIPTPPSPQTTTPTPKTMPTTSPSSTNVTPIILEKHERDYLQDIISEILFQNAKNRMIVVQGFPLLSEVITELPILKEILEERFSRHGNIANIHFVHNTSTRRACVIEYDNLESAADAIKCENGNRFDMQHTIAVRGFSDLFV